MKKSTKRCSFHCLITTRIEDKWSEMFCSLVSKAKTIQVVSSGVSGASGFLLLIFAELQALSLLVPKRQVYFLRYVKQYKEKGKWIIVDFPIEKIKPATASDDYRRRPSGCLIEEMPNGYSQVIWVEHVEVKDNHVQHDEVGEYVKGAVAFGAEWWLAVLQRQCERMACFMATNINHLGVIPSAEAKRNLMKLSQRMVRTFCLNLSNLYGQVMISERTKDTTTEVCGSLVPCGVSVTFLPCSHHQVFDLLRDTQHHEILYNGNLYQEVDHIANGSHPGNCISLLRIKESSSVEFMLQETCTDNSGSLVVCSVMDDNAFQLAMNCGDASSIPLLPLGLSIVPVNPSNCVEGKPASCFLTIQVTESNIAAERLNLSTVTAINNRIRSTVNRITSALGGSSSSVVGY